MASHLGVANREGDGHGQVHPGLEERNDLSTRAGGSDDEHILLCSRLIIKAEDVVATA